MTNDIFSNVSLWIEFSLNNVAKGASCNKNKLLRGDDGFLNRDLQFAQLMCQDGFFSPHFGQTQTISLFICSPIQLFNYPS